MTAPLVGTVVFGDVVDSRHDPGSSAWLRSLCADLEAAYPRDARLASFAFTQGDEIQGLLAPDADPFLARPARRPAAGRADAALGGRRGRGRARHRARDGAHRARVPRRPGGDRTRQGAPRRADRAVRGRRGGRAARRARPAAAGAAGRPHRAPARGRAPDPARRPAPVGGRGPAQGQPRHGLGHRGPGARPPHRGARPGAGHDLPRRCGARGGGRDQPAPGAAARPHRDGERRVTDTVLVLTWLVFAHLVADFVLQNDWIAMNKATGGREGWRALGVHGFHVGAVPRARGARLRGPRRSSTSRSSS